MQITNISKRIKEEYGILRVRDGVSKNCVIYECGTCGEKFRFKGLVRPKAKAGGVGGEGEGGGGSLRKEIVQKDCAKGQRQQQRPFNKAVMTSSTPKRTHSTLDDGDEDFIKLDNDRCKDSHNNKSNTGFNFTNSPLRGLNNSTATTTMSSGGGAKRPP